MLIEIQALVNTEGPRPRRLSVGLDKDRLAVLLGITSSLRGKPLPKANVPKNLKSKDYEGLTIYAVERVEQAMEVVRSL